VDLSALIFVAVAVAWTVYLVPKALRHHEEDAVSRSVDGFSDRLRVLARREPVSASEARLVVEGSATTATDVPDRPAATDAAEEQPSAATSPAPVPPTPAPLRARRAAAAARRRRRVLGVILLANLVLAALAAGGLVAWAWTAIPAGLLVAWLVACRLMVKRERVARVAATAPRAKRRRTTLADQAIAEELSSDDTSEIPVVAAEVAEEEPVDSSSWEPVPITLPTYVDKASVGRTVRTIDLDSTGVWSSGRNASDSALAREADEAARAVKAADAAERRATGS